MYASVKTRSPARCKERRKIVSVARHWGLRLVTNYREGGGATKQEGGQVKFYPYEKGDGKSFSHAEGGGGGGGHNMF